MDRPSTACDERPSAALRAARIDPLCLARLRAEHGLNVEQRDGWVHLHQGRSRRAGVVIGTGLVGLGFLTLAVWVPFAGLPGGVAAHALRIALGVFGLGLVALALYVPFTSLDVYVSRQHLKRIRRWFGVVVRRQALPIRDLVSLDIDSTSGLPAPARYALVGRGRSGRLKLVESLPDRTLVEAIRAQVLQACALRTSG